MVDWQSLLAGRTNGLTAAVSGARVGDRLEAIPLDRATQIETSPPGVRRSRGTSGCFDITEDGRRIPVSRDTLISELQEYPGRVYLDRTAYQLEGGTIRRIWIRGGPLAGLALQAEADIDRALGTPIGVERKLGWAIHHFPALSLSVGWHVAEGRVEHVAFGPVEWAPPVFSAADVLAAWLDGRLTRNSTEPKDRDSSVWVRYARADALLKAFDLGSPADFAEGKFLRGRAPAAYPRAAAAIDACARVRHRATNDDDLPSLFWWLLTYRVQAHRMLTINSGWLLASQPGTLAAIQLTDKTNTQVQTALADVDALLLEMISPTGKRLPLKEMVETWRYPDVDLGAIEAREL